MKEKCNCSHKEAPEVLKFSKVRDVKTPERGTRKSVGIDFFIPTTTDLDLLLIRPQEDVLIPSGIVANIPSGYMLMAADKSGVATSKRACELTGRVAKADAFESPTLLGAKIVDEDYQGEIFLHLINLGNSPIVLTAGQKIAQFILVPAAYCTIEEVKDIDNLFEEVTERGTGALGSTNK